MEPEVPLQHGAEILRHVRHARMQSCHQARVERQKVQPERSVSHHQTEYVSVTAPLCGDSRYEICQVRFGVQERTSAWGR